MALQDEVARFYAACVVAALESLHSQDYVYRVRARPASAAARPLCWSRAAPISPANQVLRLRALPAASVRGTFSRWLPVSVRGGGGGGGWKRPGATRLVI